MEYNEKTIRYSWKDGNRFALETLVYLAGKFTDATLKSPANIANIAEEVEHETMSGIDNRSVGFAIGLFCNR